MSGRAVVVAALAAGLLGCATAGGDAAARWRGLAVLGPLEAGLLALDGTREPLDPRLAFAWGDVCGERDPSARRQALAAAPPRLEKALEEARRHRTWTVPLRQALGPWDPTRGGFSTGLRIGATVRFDRSDYCQQALGFLVAFTNGDEFSVLRLSEAEARGLVRANAERLVRHDLEVEVVGARPGPPAPTLLVRILRRRTLDGISERVLLDTGPEPPP